MTPDTRSSVVYVLPDKMGGMANIIAGLLAWRVPDGMEHHVIFTRNRRNVDAPCPELLAADSHTTVDYVLPRENLHTVMRRLARAVPAGGGVYVAGDLLDLATASVHDFGRAVLFMLHGDIEYYYDLAVRHDPVVHGFITYSARIHDQLLDRLPHRAETIFHLPYGVPIPSSRRVASAGPLRAVYAGRLANGQKGVFDLPEIDRALIDRGIRLEWTVVGAGPDEEELTRRWAFNAGVRWLGAAPRSRVLEIYGASDVLVLPTRFEGFPVSLLEAMSAGVVPVVSDIASGVPETVTSGVTGERVVVGDIRGFADRLAALDADRGRLEAMSVAGRHEVLTRFDIRDRVAGYQALYRRWRELYRPLAAGARLQYGSRLDRPWIPNSLVSAVRAARRRRA